MTPLCERIFFIAWHRRTLYAPRRGNRLRTLIPMLNPRFPGGTHLYSAPAGKNSPCIPSNRNNHPVPSGSPARKTRSSVTCEPHKCLPCSLRIPPQQFTVSLISTRPFYPSCPVIPQSFTESAIARMSCRGSVIACAYFRFGKAGGREGRKPAGMAHPGAIAMVESSMLRLTTAGSRRLARFLLPCFLTSL